MQLNKAEWQGSLSLPTGVEHTEENQVRMDLEGSAQRLKAQKGEEDPPPAEWSPSVPELLMELSCGQLQSPSQAWTGISV